MLTQPKNFPLAMWTGVLDMQQGKFSQMHVMVYSHLSFGEHFLSVGPMLLWGASWWVSLSVPLQVSGKGPSLGQLAGTVAECNTLCTIWLPTHCTSMFSQQTIIGLLIAIYLHTYNVYMYMYIPQYIILWAGMSWLPIDKGMCTYTYIIASLQPSIMLWRLHVYM